MTYQEKVDRDANFQSINELDSKPETFGRLDSGTSWIMVVASFAINFIVFGTGSIYGVFLAHYTANEFKDVDRSILQLVGGFAPAIFAVFSLPAGMMIGKIGNRAAILLSCVLFSGGLIVASFATQVWHLFIGQAICLGIAISLFYIPTVSIIPQWFDKYRGIALGLAASGSGIGGLVLSPMTQAIIDSIGIRWALRINAIIGAAIILPCAFILKSRLPPAPQKRLIDYSVIFDRKFLSFWTMGFFSGFGYWTPFFMLPLYCKYYGLSPSTSSLIVGLLNGGSAIGRIGMGQVSVFIGNVNTIFICHLIVALSFLVIWHFATAMWSLMLFAIIFGIFSGAFYTLSPLIAPQLYGVEKLAQVNGPFFTSLAPGCFTGTLISQAIITAYTTQQGDQTIINYLPMQIYLFAAYILSCVFILVLRFQLSSKIFAKI
jgi:MFS family permease